jgi:hypothetical protein
MMKSLSKNSNPSNPSNPTLSSGRCLASLACALTAALWSASAHAAPVPVDLGALSASSGSRFGGAIDVDGNLAVIGAGGGFVGINNSGSACVQVYDRASGFVWGLERVVAVPADYQDSTSNFGASVAISGNWLAVGAPGEFRGAMPSSRVFLFERNAGGTGQWGLVKIIERGIPGFGDKVALSGNRLAVSASAYQGEDQVFFHERHRGGTNQWGLEDAWKYPAPSGGVFLLGEMPAPSVAISGTTAVISAMEGAIEFIFGERAGSSTSRLTVLERDGSGSWNETATIAKNNQLHFGRSLALDGNYLVAGSIDYTDPANSAHTVFVFHRNYRGAGAWGQVMAESRTETGWGAAVDISGDTIVAGFFTDLFGGRYNDAAVFERSGGVTGWSQTRLILSSSPGDALDKAAVAVNGDVMLLGMPQANLAGEGSGGAEIRERNEGGADNWGRLVTAKKLPRFSQSFGESIAMHRNFMVVGDPLDDTMGADAGAAHVFLRYVSTDGIDEWRPAYKLTASDASPGDRFGASVSVLNGLVAVGAPEHEAGRGAVYLYGSAQTAPGVYEWTEIRRVVSSDRQDGDKFGAAVSLGETGSASSRRLAVGAWGEDTYGSSAGAAYLFEENIGGEDNWGQRRKVVADDADGLDSFGISVSLSGDRLVVGAWLDEDSGGAVYVFEKDRNGTNAWGQIRKISQASGASPGGVGFAVCLVGDRLAIGTQNLLGLGAGKVFLHERNLGGSNRWGLRKTLSAPVPESGDGFGRSLALDGDLLVIGSPGKDAGPVNGAGGVHAYGKDTGGLNQWGRLLSFPVPSSAESTRFGTSVAADFGAIAAGAPDRMIEFTDRGQAFSWRMGSFELWASSRGLTAVNAGLGEDPDRDGRSNLAEFALGTDPLRGDGANALTWGTYSNGRPWLNWQKPAHDTTGMFPEGQGLGSVNYGGRMSFTSSAASVVEDSSTRYRISLRGGPPEGETRGYLRMKFHYPSFR